MSLSSTANEPTFAQPIHLLGDCHRRIEKFLERLIDIAQQPLDAPLTEESRQQLDTALRYFDQLPGLHNADEEESLFPRLRRLANSDSFAAAQAQQALAVMERLEQDHEIAEDSHATIATIGKRWLDEKRLSATTQQQLRSELRSLRAFYVAHIALEDDLLFPLAKQLLGDNELELVGREMAARRGVDYDAPDAIHRCARRKRA